MKRQQITIASHDHSSLDDHGTLDDGIVAPVPASHRRPFCIHTAGIDERTIEGGMDALQRP